VKGWFTDNTPQRFAAMAGMWWPMSTDTIHSPARRDHAAKAAAVSLA